MQYPVVGSNLAVIGSQNCSAVSCTLQKFHGYINHLIQGRRSQYGYSGFGRSRFWPHVLSWFASSYLLSCHVTTRLVLVAIVLVTERRSVPGAAYACALLYNSLVLDTCMSSCSIEIHVQSNYMSIPFADTNVQD